MIATAEIKRPALRYYGGKWKLAPWIISHFPAHKNYVEPCGGAASVLLQKPRSPLETYNDLDGNVVNFFRVLRDRPEELIRKIRLTPWARAEYELSLQPCEDETEKARRFFMSAWMSFNGGTGDNPRLFGWRHTKDSRLRLPAAFDIINNDLEQVSSRLAGVQIEQRDFVTIIEVYDNDEALIYIDPPYVASERTNNKDWYACEWTDTDHQTAAALLRSALGYVIVSGYACPLYTELYEAHGWTRYDKEAQTNGGGKRIESIWLSPRTVEAVGKPMQAELFR
jgi:DNA adenine methylase